MLRRATLLWAVAFQGCTDSGLYTDLSTASGPDRTELQGQVCVPLAAGEAFPLKVIFALEGGASVLPDTRGIISAAVSNLLTTHSDPTVSYELIEFHTLATALVGQFSPGPSMSTPLGRYVMDDDAGPVAPRAPLLLANSLLSGDMQTGCHGTTARTRYLVVLIMASADTSCANPVFNPGVDDACNNLLPDTAKCSVCELTHRTQDLRALAQANGAGEVDVQPIYLQTTPLADPAVLQEIQAIAEAGGTQALVSDAMSLNGRLNALSLVSLQRTLTLKQLIAFNINYVARNGAVLVDSDGDGLPDIDEVEHNTDPRNPDTDGDGIRDGIEVKMGMDPLTVDIISGCTTVDTDSDRLNDCEERVLGTDPCTNDTDGDGLPDLIEFLGGTNPLVPEDLQDTDHDGRSNIAEVLAHTDPNSVDVAFAQARGTGYSISDVDADGVQLVTPDGRSCDAIDAFNLTLVSTLSRPDGQGGTIPAGANDLYLYLVAGWPNDPRGTGIDALDVERVIFTAPGTKVPRGIIRITPEQLIIGQ